MEEKRQCSACDKAMVGPFEPELSLIMPAPEEGPGQDATAVIRAWICPGCGLAQWYAQEQDLEQLADIAQAIEELEPKPGASYERRMQVLRMLRRVRRM
jgi:hypothetical protein